MKKFLYLIILTIFFTLNISLSFADKEEDIYSKVDLFS